MTRPQSISQLCTQMLEALEIFDASIPPYGLYAAGDLFTEYEPKDGFVRQRHPEWFYALSPFLGELDGNMISQFKRSPKDLTGCLFRLPDFGIIELKIAKISKIKVRQYGSQYHLDKHEKFNDRWDELNMDQAISYLWSNSNYGHIKKDFKMLLFIGFDKAQRPFDREFSQLNPHNKREEHDVLFESRDWVDKVGRGFSIRTAIWSHAIMPMEKTV